MTVTLILFTLVLAGFLLGSAIPLWRWWRMRQGVKRLDSILRDVYADALADHSRSPSGWLKQKIQADIIDGEDPDSERIPGGE